MYHPCARAPAHAQNFCPKPYSLNPRHNMPRAEQPRVPSLCRSSSRPSRKLGCWDSCRRMLSTFTPPTTWLVSLHLPRSLSASDSAESQSPVALSTYHGLYCPDAAPELMPAHSPSTIPCTQRHALHQLGNCWADGWLLQRVHHQPVPSGPAAACCWCRHGSRRTAGDESMCAPRLAASQPGVRDADVAYRKCRWEDGGEVKLNSGLQVSRGQCWAVCQAGVTQQAPSRLHTFSPHDQ